MACAGGLALALALAWHDRPTVGRRLLCFASHLPTPHPHGKRGGERQLLRRRLRKGNEPSAPPFLLPFLDVKLRPSPWIRSGWRGAEVGTGGRAAGGRDRIPRNGSHELETRRRRRWRGVEEVGRSALRRQLLPRPALHQQVNPAAAPAPDSVPRLQFEIPSLLELLASLSWPLLEIPVVRLSLCSLHLGPAASGGWIPVSP